MNDETDLRGLLHAYANGDVLARKVLLDLLEENGDERAEALRAETIDWNAVAQTIARPYDWSVERCRWFIDCARFGSTAPPEVVDAVRLARENWLRGLFPELYAEG